MMTPVFRPMASERFHLLFGCILLGVFFISACGNSQGTTPGADTADTASAALSIHWHPKDALDGGAAPPYERSVKAIGDCGSEGVAYIRCSVYEVPDTLLVESDVWSCGQRSGLMQGVPTGPDRKFVCLGLDGDGNNIYRGEIGGITIRGDQTNVVGTLDAYPFETGPVTNLRDEPPNPARIYLEWERVPGAASYIVQIAEDADFSRVPFHRETGSTHLVAGGWDPQRTYFWRVIPRDLHGNEGIFFPAQQFETAADAFTTVSIVGEWRYNTTYRSDYWAYVCDWGVINEQGNVNFYAADGRLTHWAATGQHLIYESLDLENCIFEVATNEAPNSRPVADLTLSEPLPLSGGDDFCTGGLIVGNFNQSWAAQFSADQIVCRYEWYYEDQPGGYEIHTTVVYSR